MYSVTHLLEGFDGIQKNNARININNINIIFIL
jgi:hypothetical protein